MNVYTETHPIEQERAKLAAVLVHGAADHCGRYKHVIEALNTGGYPVVTGDLPGSGRTEGLAGHVDSFDEYLDAVEQWVAEAVKLSTSGRVALIGHSMGGLIVLRFLQERAASHPEVAAAVVTSPCLRLSMKVPAWKQWLGRQLATLTPRLRMPSEIDPASVSRSPHVIAAYAEDPYCGGKVSVRWFEELNRAMEQTRAAAGQVDRPLMIMQAGADRVVDAREAELFYQGLKDQEQSCLVQIPDAYHELLNEPEWQQTIDRIVSWLDKETAAF